jgi:hypothetical protein
LANWHQTTSFQILQLLKKLDGEPHPRSVYLYYGGKRNPYVEPSQ